MITVPTAVVDEAVRTLESSDGGELLMLLLPYGTPAAQRAGLLAHIGALTTALRGRGVDAQVLRVPGQELQRRGIESGAQVEAIFVLYAGAEPTLPDED